VCYGYPWTYRKSPMEVLPYCIARFKGDKKKEKKRKKKKKYIFFIIYYII
jgi:hypothetical protein